MPSYNEGDVSQTRMQTRATNSNKHPGAVVQAASRVHRDPTVVQKEKDARKARKEAKEQQVAQEEAAETALEVYRSQQRTKARNDEKVFPRQQPWASGGMLQRNIDYWYLLA
jgi:hypothetical protein